MGILAMNRVAFLKTLLHWEDLSEEFLNLLEAMFASEPEDYFQQFIQLSERYWLLEEQYAPLAKKAGNDHAQMAGELAMILHKKGKALLSQTLINQNREYEIAAALCYYFATKADSNYFSAFFALAALFARQGNTAEATRYLNEGDQIYRRLEQDIGKTGLQKQWLESFDRSLIEVLRAEIHQKAAQQAGLK